MVVFKEFGDSTVNASLYFWIDAATTSFPAMQDAAVKEVKTAFEREEINIHYPIRTIYVNQVTT
jgi:small-conductance mechanosensitive channel